MEIVKTCITLYGEKIWLVSGKTVSGQMSFGVDGVWPEERGHDCQRVLIEAMAFQRRVWWCYAMHVLLSVSNDINIYNIKRSYLTLSIMNDVWFEYHTY